MSGGRWADIVDDPEASDAEASDEVAGPAAQTDRRRGANAQRRSGAQAGRQRAERAAQRAARAAAAEPVPRAGGRTAVNRVLLAAQGGLAGGGPAAGGHRAAPVAPMTAALQEMLVGYRDYLALPDDVTRLAFLREHSSFKPAPIELFTAGPGDISVFAKILDTGIKIATTIAAARSIVLLLFLQKQNLSTTTVRRTSAGRSSKADSLEMRRAWHAQRLPIRLRRINALSACMEPCSRCSRRIFRPALPRSGVPHAHNLFFLLTQLRVGRSLCACMTCNVQLQSLHRRRCSTSSVSILRRGGVFCKCWRIWWTALLRRPGSRRRSIPLRPKASKRGHL
jgi:hypothetical protein